MGRSTAKKKSAPRRRTRKPFSRRTVTEVRSDLGKILDRVEKGRRVIVERGGEPVAALVPAEDLFDRLEDEADLQVARRRLREMKRSGEKPIPFDELCRELDLE